jgi:hypothetical protein
MTEVSGRKARNRIRVAKQRDAHTQQTERSIPMSVGTILLIVLIVILIGALPAWPYSTSWGYGPSGIAGLVALVLLILLLTGRL